MAATSQFEMVMNMKRKGTIKSIQVLQVLNLIDRKKFVDSTIRHPYEDKPEPLGHNATISAPHMHALALEYLKDQLIRGNRILDVGSGSGYLTSCMATMVDKHGIVVAVEHVKEILQASHANIINVMPNALKLGQIFLVHGDGRHGYELMAPYDAIHMGAVVDKIPQALISQLKPGGKIFAIVGAVNDGHQKIQILTKDNRGNVDIEEIPACCVSYETLTDVQLQSPKSARLPANSERYQPVVNDKLEKAQNLKPKEEHKESPSPVVRHHVIQVEQPKRSTTVTVNGYTYDVTKCLGEGGFGKVYKGARQSDQKPVAVKVIENVEDWQAPEWNIPEQVRNPHLVTLMGHFNVATTTYLIMELLDCDLKKLLGLSGGKFSIKNLQSMACQLGKGYMALFGADIIHRDIKPENVLVELTKQGARLKLGDFGCGKMLDHVEYAQTYIGTKSYMAWEVFNTRHYDARADIWSLGLVLYESYFGQHFLQSPHLAHIQEVKVLSGDKLFDDLLIKMLKFEYHERMKPVEFFAHPFHANIPHGTLISLP